MDIKQFIENHIPRMNSPEKVYELFNGLGYKTLDTSYHGKEAYGLREKEAEFIKDIYTICNYEKRFQVFLVECKDGSNVSSIFKTLPLYFEKEVQYPFFVITSDYKNYTFTFVEKIREDIGVWKRKIIRLNLDRENAYYTDKMILSDLALKKDIQDTSIIYKFIKDVFSVEKVSNIFFEDYKTTFFKIRNFLLRQNIDIKQAHEFSQQLLNRIMFIYFIDKKIWLKNSPKFMKWFWNRYLEENKKGKISKNSFYQEWLKILFLEAFNNRFSHPQYLPQDVRETLQLAPYLNGGLFKRNELDALSINLSDEFIDEIFKFFEKYNFTIREDLPLDVEVAVDPQMIGYVYESLANVAEEIYERQDLGIFYTPRIEVDFMCRRSLVEYLSKVTDIQKEILYHLIFDEDKTKIEKLLNIRDFENLESALDNLSILDPACGSGAFLVGILNLLVEIYKVIFKHLNREMTDYQLKKRIIGNSIYGVDVMPWAVHSAELRLWLSLMIESDLTLGELKLYPLLPNLNLKLRVGDSLVQEIGGINLNLRDALISQSLKKKLTELKREKEKYYNNDPTAKFKTDNAILQEELRIFYQILDERIINLEKKKQKITIEKMEQSDLFGKEKNQEKLFDEKELKEIIEKQRAKIDEEINKLIEIKHKLKEQKPLIWDIDFAEIFGEKGGFDIVIGNPPYVRQEKIAPPNKLRSEITNEEKRDYKEKLLKSVQVHFPFIKSIDKRSDYYIYFYFHGLSLLNENGTFCFITSNSWLDVGYGKDLQEFLLKYAPIIAIYDNQAKRSFEHADVNTIIALFGAPIKTVGTGYYPVQIKGQGSALSLQHNLAKFIMFKRPFEEIINTENLLKIENTEEILTTDDFRVYPKKQKDLLEEGLEDREQRTLVGKYTGNKWGGKYLRAPDIFFKILEKGKGKLVRLGDIAEVRFGIKTGANEFFYVEDVTDKIKRLEDINIYPERIFKPVEEIKRNKLRIIRPSKFGKNDKSAIYFLIEDDFLKPVIKSPRELKTILVKEEDLKYKVIMCHETRENLMDDSYIWSYIYWGEEQEYHMRPSCASRQRWWDLGERNGAEILVSSKIGERYVVHLNKNKILEDKILYGVTPNVEGNSTKISILLNSFISRLYMELTCRQLTGAQSIADIDVNVWENVLLPSPDLYKEIKINKEIFSRPIHSIFTELGINPQKSIRSQIPNPLPDRKELDDIVFDILGLTQDERNDVYWAVCELVKNRLAKARSV